MPIAIEKPANLTEGLKNFVAMISNALERGDISEAKYLAIDLYNDIGSAYVCEEKDLEVPCPVPDYDPATDGDYSSWLVANNRD